MADIIATNETILVVGGGISGMTAAIEASEAGCDVILVEKNAYLGGRVAGTNQYFPKLCPPTCGLEMRSSLRKRIFPFLAIKGPAKANPFLF